MFKQDLDVDPFRYVTLPSLCMSVYRGKFLPDETIVANEQNNQVSLLCKEWLIHLNDKNMLTEFPLVIDTSNYMNDTPDIDIEGVNSDDETVSTCCPTNDVPSDTASVISSVSHHTLPSLTGTPTPSLAQSSCYAIPQPPPQQYCKHT